jgi:hypothetical protein
VAVHDPSVSSRTRHLVHAFLLVFAVTGLAHLELHPFSGFRLFAEVRGEERTSWDIEAVDADGRTIPIVLDDLPLGYRQSWRFIPSLDERPRSERDAICDAWTVPLRDEGHEITKVRVFRTVRSVRPEAPPGERSLVLECGGPAR